MCSGRTPSVRRRASAGSTTGPSVPAMTAPPGTALELQQVHRRRADEARDERVGGPSRRDRRACPFCSMRPPLSRITRSAIDIASTWSCVTYTIVMPSLRCSARISCRISARKLRIEVRQRLVHQAHRRLVDDRAAQRHALLLAAGQLRRLARQQRRQAQQVAPPAPAACRTRRPSRAARAGRTGCSPPPTGAGTARSSGTPSRCCAAPAAAW